MWKARLKTKRAKIIVSTLFLIEVGGAICLSVVW